MEKPKDSEIFDTVSVVQNSFFDNTFDLYLEVMSLRTTCFCPPKASGTYPGEPPSYTTCLQGDPGPYRIERGVAPTDFRAELITTGNLGYAFETEQPYENRDGSGIVIDSDFTYAQRDPEHPAIGPLEQGCRRIMLI